MPGGNDRGKDAPDAGTMTTASTRRVLLIDHMNAEWRTMGRSPGATRALHAAAGLDAGLGVLVLGTDEAPPSCPTPFDLVEHLRRASGRSGREEAARLLRVLLRHASDEAFLQRTLVQALLPGLVTVARRLRWGRGGEWQDSEEFFGELVSTAWVVVKEWSGQDRPYAVLDLLSAVRCRLRRQLFRAKGTSERTIALEPDAAEGLETRGESDLEQLARLVIELHHDGVPLEEIEVLYAHHVLGYSMSELASISGRDRRALYARQERARRHLHA